MQRVFVCATGNCLMYNLQPVPTFSNMNPVNSQIQYLNSTETFNTVMASAGDRVVLLDFTATWCKPCKKLEPVVHQLAAEFAAQIIVCKIDVDHCPELQTSFGVSSIPTFLFIRHNTRFHSLTGPAEAELVSTTMLVARAVFPNLIK